MLQLSIYDLNNICDINQGIVTGADKVTAKHIREYNWDKNVGDGIFVLSKEESKNIQNKKYLKDWYKNSDVKRFNVNTGTDQRLLYIDHNFDELESDIIEHLEQFKKNLQKRREVHKGSRRWFELWRSREEHIFEGEKIVAPQRSKVNTFGYTENPWYAASDVFFITQPKNGYDLKFLLGVLNSKLIFVWLYYRGKRKGDMLELTARPLSEIPIPDIDTPKNQETAIQIETLVDQILEAKKYNKDADTTHLEAEIDELVMDLYQLTPEEREIMMGES
jgi:adenine-specific DNA-methyltransferase